jgi:predicted alpha/beta-hydrolase family hydrolase
MAANSPSKVSIPISGSIGKVSALLSEPSKPIAVLVLAHGAGAGMTHPFMEELSAELAALGIASLRFNFPYMENQKGRPDPPAIAEKTVGEVLKKAHELFPMLPLFAGGKSFGGRMTSQRTARECPAFLRGIVFFGFPLHAPGKPGIERAAHLNEIKIPMLFLQGTRDALANIKLMDEVCSALPASAVIKFEGADHSFRVPKRNLIPELAFQTHKWIQSVKSL